MNYHRLIIIDKSKMAASKMAGWILKRPYLLLNPDMWCFRCYCSIEAMDSVKLPYGICLTNPIWRHPRWRNPKCRHFVTVLFSCSHAHFIQTVTFDHYIGVTFIFTTRQPLRIHCPSGRRPTNVYEFATISDWCTDGWHRTKLASI